jgi:hypothetical protein
MKDSLPPELTIKLDYLKNRANPSEVFEAMGLYIHAYKDLGQLITNSVGVKDDFNFQLNDIQGGSVLSKLSVIGDKLDGMLELACYNSAISTVENLIDIDETETEEQVIELAEKIEAAVADNMPNSLASPHIDRKNLAYILHSISAANEKMRPSERVLLNSSGKPNKWSEVNTKWRFRGNPSEMFTGSISHHKANLKLQVKIAVNEGDSSWTFRCNSFPKPFSARITHQIWLEKYQQGLIQPIGPMDTIDASVTYDRYTPSLSGEVTIRNAKIKTIIDIDRFTGYQHELDA